MDPLDQAAWTEAWEFDPQTVYLNHGSFGPAPKVVQEARIEWFRRLERQPFQFYLRELEDHLDRATGRMAHFLNAPEDCLAFVPNSTCAMNVVAASVSVEAGDEVLLSDHEYGAVDRLWTGVCESRGARKVIATLPAAMESKESVTDCLFDQVTDRTRLIVISQVTSPTAIILPVAEICRRARQLRVPVCVDGAHALASLPVDLQQMDCDYWTSSCHKWLSAPVGSGLLYVRHEHHGQVRPAIVSWGRSLSGRDNVWQDELHWFGTYDPSPYLATSDALNFLEQVGWDRFRTRTHQLAQQVRGMLVDAVGAEPLTPDGGDWYPSMVALRLPGAEASGQVVGRPHPLQAEIYRQFGIEVPVYRWKEDTVIRVSCHLYNSTEQLTSLVEGLSKLLA